MNKQADLKLITDYVTLSMSRVVESDKDDDQLKHYAAIRFRDDKPVEYIDIYVENNKKRYDKVLNKKPYPFKFAISTLRSWLEVDPILLHEGGRNDIQWLYDQLDIHLKLHISNTYINIEDLAIINIGLKKTSLKNIAKYYGVYQPNKADISKDLYKCMLIHKIWVAYKES